jgi:hypothetical protein
MEFWETRFSDKPKFSEWSFSFWFHLATFTSFREVSKKSKKKKSSGCC